MYILHCIVLHLILSHLFCRSINKLQIKIKMSNPQALLNNHFPTRIPVNKEIRDFYERSYPQLVPGTLHVAGTCSELVFLSCTYPELVLFHVLQILSTEPEGIGNARNWDHWGNIVWSSFPVNLEKKYHNF